MNVWGAVKRRLRNHTDREVQDSLFAEVIRRLYLEDVVPMEGGPGAGKSLVVSPMLWTNQRLGGGDRVIISAFTKAQQDVLYLETAPRVVELTPRGAVMLKGQDNYICLRRAREAGFANVVIDGDGARACYPYLRGMWDLVCSDRDAGCSGDDCGDDDAYYKVRQAAMTADLVITNHKLLTLNLRLGGLIFGETSDDLLVVDEAHLIERVLQETFGGHLTPPILRRLDADLVPYGTGLGDSELMLSAELARLGPRVPWESWDAGAKLVEEIQTSYTDLVILAAEIEDGERWSELKKVRRLLTRVGTVLEVTDRLAAEVDTHAVFTGETRRSQFVEVRKYDIRDEFASLTRRYRKTVVMSATLAQLARERLGLPSPVTAAEPFDARSQRLAYCVPSDPEANKANQWSESVLLELVDASRGGALVVANSHAEKERAADALRAAGWRVGMQSAGSEEVKALVAELVAGEINVLVGTDSVGTGIDVPGDALRLVVLLSPFNPNPFNDVFLDMWSMRFGYHRRWPALLNKMADEKMHQAIGRLLRTPTDRGVVAFIEPRPAHQSRFLSWVIPSTVTRDLADVERFFA